VLLVLRANYVETDDPPRCIEVAIAPVNILVIGTFFQVETGTSFDVVDSIVRQSSVSAK